MSNRDQVLNDTNGDDAVTATEPASTIAEALTAYRAAHARVDALLATATPHPGGPQLDPELGPQCHEASDAAAEATMRLAEAVDACWDDPNNPPVLMRNVLFWVEGAMKRESIDRETILRVMNRVLYGEPEGANARREVEQR